MQTKVLKIAATLSALCLLAGCGKAETNVQLRNMSGSPAVVVLKQSRLRLANGQVFELSPRMQATALAATADQAPIVRLALAGGADQCFALKLDQVPDSYYSSGVPKRLAVELGQDGNLAAFPKPGTAPRAGVNLPKVACGG